MSFAKSALIIASTACMLVCTHAGQCAKIKGCSNCKDGDPNFCVSVSVVVYQQFSFASCS